MGSVSDYLDILDDQRESIFQELGAIPDDVLWCRPMPIGSSHQVRRIRVRYPPVVIFACSLHYYAG